MGIFTVAAIASFVAFVIVPTIILIYRVLNPVIIQFPWPNVDAPEAENRTVVFAGSFNPPHNGHLAMVKYLAQKHQEVILVIGMNPNKTYKVSPSQRADLLERMVASLGLDKSRVRVKVVSGYIWRYAMSQNASIFYRGIRTWEKDGGEERALHILNSWGPLIYGPLKWPIKTRFMEGDTRYLHVSSTLIRNACLGDNQNDLEGLVPKNVQDDIMKAYK